MDWGPVILLVIVVSGIVGLLGFLRGDSLRRAASGHQGPRPIGSVGEALRKVGLKQKYDARVLVFFLGDSEACAETRRALAQDEAVIRVIAQHDLVHVVVPAGREDRQVAEALSEKYGHQGPLRPPSVLLLDAKGETVAQTDAETQKRRPWGQWLETWVHAQPKVATPPQ